MLNTGQALSAPTLAAVGAKRLADRDKDLFNALSLVGNPAAVKLPVHTPQLNGLTVEGENFKWFVDNEASDRNHPGPHQALGSLNRSSKQLPSLRRQPRKKAL
jgi:hypothetical protein